MARIPLGNQGDVVAQTAPDVQYRPSAFGAQTGQAVEQIGAQGQQVAANLYQQKQQLDDDLQRTSAAVAYQQHQTDVQVAVKDADQKLQTGELDQVGYVAAVNDARQQSYDATIGALPDNHYKRITQVQAQGLNRTVDLSTQAALMKSTQQQIATNVGSMLDTGGKSIALNPGSINEQVASVGSAYLSAAPSAGIPPAVAQKTVTDWSNKQYYDHANTAIIQARAAGDVGALTAVERALTASDGFYAGKMTPEQRNQALSSVVSQRLTLENQQSAADQARETQAVGEYNKALDLMNQGKRFSPAYIQQLTDATTGTAAAADTQRLIAAAGQNAGFSSLSLPAMRAGIQKDQSEANTPGVGTDPLTAAAVKQRQQIYTASVEAYKTDPWNAALDRGVIQQIPPLDTSSIPNLLTSIQGRAAAAGVIDQQAGRRVSLFTPDEASKVLDTINSLSTDAKSQVLTQIGAASNNAARINDLADQWKEKNPSVALALKAGSAGGDGQPLMTTKGRPVASYILDGQQAIVDKTVKIDEAAGTGMRAQIATQINGTLPPNQEQDAKEMAYYIAISNAHRNGREQPNTGDVQGGIDTATGGISNTGGTLPTGKPRQVARPYGWSDDEFQASVKTAGAGNIENQIGGAPIDTVYANGKPIPAGEFMAKFPSYQLMRVGVRGTFAVVTGSKFVTDASGAPVTIHLTRGQKPQAAASTSPQVQTGTIENPF
ncbi:hypothetical protein BYI23_B004750 [Burkholderia sp. YI23]|nr:hypothetical protein BYI23_B004750 [Burkholderia sp. YI23]